jgi:flagellar hook-associated protein 2
VDQINTYAQQIADVNERISQAAVAGSSNEFTLDGIAYTFNDTTSEEATVTVTRDTESIYTNISNFVADYNTLIETINGLLSEEYDYDYPPLTDDQKDEMSESEIEKWETTSKTGILASSSYEDKGKLTVDEAELKAAIEADPEGIMDLFTQQCEEYSGTSTVRTLSSDEREVRYREEGLAYRFYDILQDNIGTTRDSGGNKGLLLEKAGMEGDTSESDNSLSDQLAEYAERIAKEEDRLDDYQESLYSKYTSLETYISKMNTQLSSLTSMLES